MTNLNLEIRIKDIDSKLNNLDQYKNKQLIKDWLTVLKNMLWEQLVAYEIAKEMKRFRFD